MNETLALPLRLVMRDLMLTAFAQKARLFLIFFCIMAVSIVIATLVQPDYKADPACLSYWEPNTRSAPPPASNS